MRKWGIFLIPRDQAPEEGFLLTRGTKLWRAWRLPLDSDGNPKPRPCRADEDLQVLLDDLVVGYIDDGSDTTA